MLDKIWVWMIAAAVVFALVTGRMEALTASVLEGAGAAVTLCVGIAGTMALFSGLMEVMRGAGLARGLARLLHPLLSRLFPAERNNPGALEAVGANVCANVLGMANAATPFGLDAARRIHERQMGSPEEASDSLCMLVVLNASSLQLLPSTVAALRAAAGSAAPYDILPAVWLCSAAALAAGLGAAFLLRRLGRRRGALRWRCVPAQRDAV